MKVRVYHSYFGCDTGCCGHVLEIDDTRVDFDFMHSYNGLTREAAIELAKQTIAQTDPKCLSSIDWSTFEMDVTSSECS